MEKKSKTYTIEGKQYALIGDKLVLMTTMGAVVTPKTRSTMAIPAKTRKDVPVLLNAMSKEATIKAFGFMVSNPHDTPYHCIGISKFYADNNIVLTGYQKVGLTYGEKHIILDKQLHGESSQVRKRVMAACIKAINSKLMVIPTTAMSDKVKDSMTKALRAEIQRWNNEKA